MLFCLHYGPHPHTFILHLVCHVAHTWLGGTISSTIYPWYCYHLVGYPLSPCPYIGDDWAFASVFCGNPRNCATGWYHTCSTNTSTVSMVHWGRPLAYGVHFDDSGWSLFRSGFDPVAGDESMLGFAVLAHQLCPLVR